MRKTDTIFLTALDLADPEIVQAARLLEREQVVRIAVLGPGQDKSQEPAVMVIPAEKYGRHAVWAALETVRPAGLVIRGSNEEPTISEAHARSRGFTEAEITAYLRPWIAQQRAAAERLTREAVEKYNESIAVQVRAEKQAAGLPTDSAAFALVEQLAEQERTK
jgi:hypothetical protein